MAAVQTSVAFAPSAYRAGVSSPSSRHPQHERHARNSAHQYRSSRNRSDCRSRCQTVAVRGMVPGELPEDGGAGKVGVIVCDHGSRREQANQMLFEVAERYRCFAGCDVVEVHCQNCHRSSGCLFLFARSHNRYPGRTVTPTRVIAVNGPPSLLLSISICHREMSVQLVSRAVSRTVKVGHLSSVIFKLFDQRFQRRSTSGGHTSSNKARHQVQ